MSEKNFSSFENLVNLFTNIKNAINKSEGNSALLVKDTVGWTGKNEWDIKETTGNNASVTLLSNGFRTVVDNKTWGGSVCNLFNLKKNTDYILTCQTEIQTAGNFMRVSISGRKNGVNSTIKFQNYSTDTNIEIAFNSGDNDSWIIYGYVTGEPAASGDVSILNPMIRLATISDATYEPYHESVKQTLRDAEVIEGKNFADFVNGKGVNTSGEVVDDANRIATVNPIAIKAGVNYRYVSALTTAQKPNCIYAVWNDNTLVRRVAGVESGTVLDTSGGNKLYVCAYSSSAVTIDTSLAMVVDSNETDLSYEPYYIPLKDSKFDRAEQRVLGAKNLLPTDNYGYNRASSSWTDIINEDGSVTITYSDSSQGSYGIFNQANVREEFINIIKGKRVTITGGKSNTVYLQWWDDVTGGVLLDKGDGISFVVPSNMTSYNLSIKFNSITNERFYVMLRLASDPDDTYVPYAMTNRELTDAVEIETLYKKDYASAFTLSASYQTLNLNGDQDVDKYLRLILANDWNQFMSFIIPAEYRAHRLGMVTDSSSGKTDVVIFRSSADAGSGTTINTLEIKVVKNDSGRTWKITRIDQIR